jgi:hypothetical protein
MLEQYYADADKLSLSLSTTTTHSSMGVHGGAARITPYLRQSFTYRQECSAEKRRKPRRRAEEKA